MDESAAVDGSWRLVTERPDRRLRPGVRSYRGFALDLRGVQQRLELPHGTVSLVVNFDAPVWLTQAVGRPSYSAYQSLMEGPRTTATIGRHNGSMRGVEVIMTPWAAYRVLGMPMSDLRELVVPVPDVLGADGRELEERLACAGSWGARFAVLDAFLLRRAAVRAEPAPQVVSAWHALRRSGGAVSLAGLADRIGWSERHLCTRFREQIGLPPKKIARVFRLSRALDLVAERESGSTIAADCGFFDQAHFNREFRAMVGRSPSEFAGHLLHPSSARPVGRLPGRVTSALLG